MASSGEYILFAWGANSYGQLGLGHKADTLLPSKSQLEAVVVKRLQLVAGGGGHSVLITGATSYQGPFEGSPLASNPDEGEVHVFGWNKNGQLGVPPCEEVTVPHPLASKLPHSPTVRVEKVSCGWNHTLAIGDGGSLIVWGSNAFGQLGVPDVVKHTERPIVLQQQEFSGSKLVDVGAGLRHSTAVTENGVVYSWGDDKKGQLGHGRTELSVQPTPKCVASLASHKCRKVSAGGYHSLAVTEDGEVFAWGLNQHGQCGVGELTDRLKLEVDAEGFRVSGSNWILNVYQPLVVKGLPAVSEVCCGWSHVLAVTVHRQSVYAWGRSDYGQLGLGNSREKQSPDQLQSSQSDCCPEPREIPQLQGTRQVACGSEHNIAINVAKQVVTFGWNEHGMCATGDETNVYHPHTVESLRDWEPLLVGAGAGHSFVVAKLARQE